MAEEQKPKPQQKLDFAISKITAKLLELFRQELQRRLGLPISTAEAVAFIVEDYSKSYYANVSETKLR